MAYLLRLKSISPLLRNRSTLMSTTMTTTKSNKSALFSNKRSFATEKPSSVPLTSLTESFLSSPEYVDRMFEAWKENPKSVHVSWQAYFENVERGKAPGTAHAMPPPPGYTAPASTSFGTASNNEEAQNTLIQSLHLDSLIRSYQRNGHRLANLDPLGLQKTPEVPELDYKYWGFTDADLDKDMYIQANNSPFIYEGKKTQKLRDVISKLKEIYCGSSAVNYTHLLKKEQRDWIRDKWENPKKFQFNKEDKINALDRLLWADLFEKILQKRFGQDKRFGLDGTETLVPGMKTMIDRAAELGVESITMGMPHRGRLNVLANVVRKPFEQIFSEFKKPSADEAEKKGEDFSFYSGDVKYHLGTSYTRPTRGGSVSVAMRLSLLANPSHLEAVDPVVEGKTRARQTYGNDTTRKLSMSVHLHGDAAFAGQGVVYETMQLSGVSGYTTGGVVHIVVNNQIGFTTDPIDSRSTLYCTDLAKAFDAPIFHVNADDVDAVLFVFRTAVEWRQQFGKDIVIDLIGYRRFGHNELDEPKFTQPLMYQQINQHSNSVDIYANKLISEGILTKQEKESMISAIDKQLEEDYQKSLQFKDKPSNWFESKWEGFKSPDQLAKIKPTGVKIDILKQVGNAISSVPDSMKLHPAVVRDLKRKQQMIQAGEPVDWATAEALAFGSLILEGNYVRLSGQDVKRGTFSHRHCVVWDQNTGAQHIPLNSLSPDGLVKFEPTNSILSEYAVLGFELGFSLQNPNSLVLWEAQFGDFANGAQVMIDQFVAAGEAKWWRQSGLVLLLPHGYDGQGPEHSSARLERFLQLSDDDPEKTYPSEEGQRKQIQETNFQVCNITTPANYFHALRRQVHRDFRKPLIIMSPKSLLRHPSVKSPLDDFDDIGQGHEIRFQRVIPEVESEKLVKPEKIRKLIFCSGQVYYALAEERTKRNINDIAIVRIEQIAPFPYDRVKEQIALYKNADVAWVQEEHMNGGAWSFVKERIVKCLGNKKQVKYVGRPVSASTATGILLQHKLQKDKFLGEAFA